MAKPYHTTDARKKPSHFQGSFPQPQRIAASHATGEATAASRRAHAKSNLKMDYKHEVHAAKEKTARQ